MDRVLWTACRTELPRQSGLRSLNEAVDLDGRLDAQETNRGGALDARETNRGGGLALGFGSRP